jgi:hypothetical protein
MSTTSKMWPWSSRYSPPGRGSVLSVPIRSSMSGSRPTFQTFYELEEPPGSNGGRVYFGAKEAVSSRSARAESRPSRHSST